MWMIFNFAEYSFKSNDGWNVSYRCLYNKGNLIVAERLDNSNKNLKCL